LIAAGVTSRATRTGAKILDATMCSTGDFSLSANALHLPGLVRDRPKCAGLERCRTPHKLLRRAAPPGAEPEKAGLEADKARKLPCRY
jgi:hypothetical protein